MYAATTTSEMSGAATKKVTCEECGQRFQYVVNRYAAGDHVSLVHSEAADQRAQQVAELKLRKALLKAVDVVGCPECGHIQSRMVKAKRVKAFKVAALLAGITPAPVVAIVLITQPDNTSQGDLINMIGIGVVIAVALVFAIAAVLALMFRPNAGKFFPFSKETLDNGEALSE